MSQITGSTKMLCVIGDPVSHSRSPAIHNAALQELGLDYVYTALTVEDGSTALALEAMRKFGIAGMNVTMPHKQAVADLVDNLTPEAAKLKSCNCVYWDGGSLVGASTDGPGFVDAYEKAFKVGFDGAEVAVVGAGGAARSIVAALGEAGAQSIGVVNRSLDKAESVAQLASMARVASQDDLPSYGIIINTTSVGMAGTVAEGEFPFDPSGLRPAQTVVDIVYNPLKTPLLEAAEAAGSKTLGGLPMLVHQAALSFEIWTKEAAPLEVMYSAAGAA